MKADELNRMVDIFSLDPVVQHNYVGLWLVSALVVLLLIAWFIQIYRKPLARLKRALRHQRLLPRIVAQRLLNLGIFEQEERMVLEKLCFSQDEPSIEDVLTFIQSMEKTC